MPELNETGDDRSHVYPRNGYGCGTGIGLTGNGDGYWYFYPDNGNSWSNISRREGFLLVAEKK